MRSIPPLSPVFRIFFNLDIKAKHGCLLIFSCATNFKIQQLELPVIPAYCSIQFFCKKLRKRKFVYFISVAHKKICYSKRKNRNLWTKLVQRTGLRNHWSFLKISFDCCHRENSSGFRIETDYCQILWICWKEMLNSNEST